jgi:hypothetical protein
MSCGWPFSSIIDVGRLHVAVDDALFVGVGERVGQRADDGRDAANVEPARLEGAFEGPARDEGRGDVILFAVLARVE